MNDHNKQDGAMYRFLGKEFDSKQSLENYKKYVFPKILAAIYREYKNQNCAEQGIEFAVWKKVCLADFQTSNIWKFKQRIGFMRINPLGK